MAVMKGRAHLYEGLPPEKVVFGVRVLGRLGIRTLVLTNASGAIDTTLEPGRLVLIKDHLNLQGSSPLVGPNDDQLGPRFPDMSNAYDTELRAAARDAAARIGVELEERVYAAWLGPAFETPAEIRMLRALGADLVGMSTVAEVLAARHMGIRCLALSCVTNMAAGVVPEPIDHEQVLAVGARAQATLTRLLRELAPALAT
jgi:purine-nucleoside phosphorylase